MVKKKVASSSEHTCDPRNCGWYAWAVFIVGVLYLLSSWTPAFGWFARSFPFDGVFFTFVGLWLLMWQK